MTLDQARRKAFELARQTSAIVYVVYDPTHLDAKPNDAYHAADDVDVDTFFAGADIVCVVDGVDPD
jgi:hypothetical protein